MSAPPRATLDVSELPEVVFGPRDTTWWGTLGFMVIESTTLAVCAASYLYLRQNAAAWPPEHVPLPSVLVPTINVLLLLATIVPMWLVGRAARRLDASGVRRWLTVAILLGALSSALRLWEFAALNVRWDRNAYGSAAWATLGFHSTLLFVDVIESLVILAIFVFGPLEEKHFTDASDAAFYQYFLSLVYVPLYVLLFLSPRWM